MAQIDDGALKNLQELLKEISRRANRLSALIGLEKSLLAMARKFDDLYFMADTAAGPPLNWNQAVEGQFKAKFLNFQRYDFESFESDVEGLLEDYAPIASDGVGANDPTKRVKAWLDGFKKDLNKIEKVIPQGATVLLGECRKHRKAHDDCIKARKRMVLQEVTTLSQLTKQVQDQLDIPVSV